MRIFFSYPERPVFSRKSTMKMMMMVMMMMMMMMIEPIWICIY